MAIEHLNREIKFRAYHNPSGQMFWFDIMNGNAHGTGSGYISMTPINEPLSKNRYKDNIVSVDPDDCVIMQFINMTDSDQKELYELDMIRHADCRNDCQIVYEEDAARFAAYDTVEHMYYTLDSSLVTRLCSIHEYEKA